MCTPLVYRGLVYIVKYNGVLNVYDAKTGEKKFSSGSPTASPLSRRHRSDPTARSTSPARKDRSTC